MTFWANSNICNSLAHGQWLYFFVYSVFNFRFPLFKKRDKYIHIYTHLYDTNFNFVSL